MSIVLRIDNFSPANIKETTLFDQDQAASGGSVTLLVKSTQGMIVGDPAFLGQLGSETCEMKFISAIPDATHITVPSLSFAHSRFDPITIAWGDKIQLYRAPNVDGGVPADVSFLQVNTPILINPDGLSTDITDPSGGSNYWYKYVYYNSTLALESDIGDSIAERGGSFGHYTTLNSIRDEAGFAGNDNIKDSLIAECRVEAESVINARLHGHFTLPLAEPIPANVSRMAKVLAAGYLLNKEFGAMNTGGTSAQGQAKIEEVLGDGKDKPGLLQELIDGTSTIVDSQDNDLATSERVSSYPEDEDDDGGFLFSTEDVY